MVKHVLVPVADGTEDIELSCITDVLVRADIKVTVASVMENVHVQLSRGLKVTCDAMIEDLSASQFDAVLLPGGLPGAEHLARSGALKSIMHEMRDQKKLFGAICAAPVVSLAPLGMLDGVKSATCYPGMESKFPSGISYSSKCVVKCGNCLTSRGPGTAMFFALAAVAILLSRDVAEKIAKGLLVFNCPQMQECLEVL